MTSVNSNGTQPAFNVMPDHDIDNFDTALPQSAKIEANKLMEPMLKYLDGVRTAWEQAKANGDNDLAKVLGEQVRAANRTLNAARKACETGSDPTVILNNVEQKLKGGDPQLDMAVGRELIKAAANHSPVGEGNLEQIGASSSGGSSSTAAESTATNPAGSDVNSLEGSEWASHMMTHPEEAIAAFESDPEQFFQQLKGLDATDRQAVIMTLQNEMQANNQLQSTLSNFLKAMHDTDKAVIANLRV